MLQELVNFTNTEKQKKIVKTFWFKMLHFDRKI